MITSLSSDRTCGNTNPKTFMDASFIAELEKTGFIARLSESLR